MAVLPSLVSLPVFVLAAEPSLELIFEFTSFAALLLSELLFSVEEDDSLVELARLRLVEVDEEEPLPFPP